MKRSVLKALVLSIALVGCASKPETKPVEPVPAVEKEKTVVVNFKFNSFKLDDAQKKLINDAVKASKEGTKVSIVGYTDSQGSKAYNKKLSEKRAKEVAHYLKTLKVENSWTAAGESKLLNKDKTKADHAANRRAELGFVVKVN